MPMNKQVDAAIELQLDMMRVDASIRGDVLKILLDLEKQLAGTIATANLTEWGRARVNKQLANVRSTIRDYYAKASELAISSTDDIAGIAVKVTADSISVGAAVAALPSESVLTALARNSIVQGAAQGAWWSRQEADAAFRFSQVVRQGIASGQTNQQMIRALRDVMEVTRANAAALVQTSVATVASDARQAVYDANDDIIKGYRALETLDARTCLECMGADGKLYDKNFKPIGHSVPYKATPRHFNCRGLYLAVIIEGPPGGTRASDKGQVAASTTFEDWLKRQPASKVDDILGKGRADLWQSGKLTLTDLVNGNGRPLRLSELRSKYAN